PAPLPAPACLRRPTTKKLDLKTTEAPDPAGASDRAGDRGRTGDVQPGKPRGGGRAPKGGGGAVGDPVRTLSSVTGAGETARRCTPIASPGETSGSRFRSTRGSATTTPSTGASH